MLSLSDKNLPNLVPLLSLKLRDWQSSRGGTQKFAENLDPGKNAGFKVSKRNLIIFHCKNFFDYEALNAEHWCNLKAMRIPLNYSLYNALWLVKTSRLASSIQSAWSKYSTIKFVYYETDSSVEHL